MHMMKPSKRAVWVCLLLGLATMAAAAAAASPVELLSSTDAAQLSPSVLMLSKADWKMFFGLDGKPQSRCLDMVARAREFTTGNKLNFVPVTNWLPKFDGLGVSSYCYMPFGNTTRSGDKMECLAWSASQLLAFKESMSACFLEAFKQGFVPYVTPQLNNAKGIWPATLLFSPLEKYGAFSYADVMITPLVEAMRDAIVKANQMNKLYTPPDANRPVMYMALQGGMSATLMRYTSDWAQLIPLVKDTVGMDLADVKVGAGLNFNALEAVEGTATTLGSAFYDALLSGIIKAPTSASAPNIQVDMLKVLLMEKLDFLGISAYSSLSGADFSVNEFQNAATSVTQALASITGVDIGSLVKSGKLELVYSQFGIGGGQNWMAKMAEAAEACAKQPWAGVSGAYSALLDPWKNVYLGAFRESFFAKALTWLMAPTDGTVVVSDVFVWSISSWDIFGIYPDSTSRGGTFRDLTIVQQIAHHNTAVMAAQICSTATTDVCNAFVTANKACLLDTTGGVCLNVLVKPIPNESGPGQPSASPVTTTPGAGPEASALNVDEAGSAQSPPQDHDYDEAGPSNQVPIGPGDSAASPAPEAAFASPTGAGSPLVATVQPAATPAASIKSSATTKQLLVVLSVLSPLLCSAMLLV